MKPRFAGRMEGLQFSNSLDTIRRIQELRAAGIEVVDFATKADTPARAKAAAARYLASDAASRYPDPRGLAELREAIAAKLLREGGVRADPETEITVAAGGKMGILSVLLALVGPGDEVLLEDPGWLAFEPMVRIAGATPVPVPLAEADGWRLNLDAVEARITPRTRLLVLCSPHNPTGKMIPEADLRAIGALAERHDLLVLVDEAYEHFVYDGHHQVSLLALPGMAERTIVAQTTSKSYNMFGWRVGWIVANPAISEKVRIVTCHSVTGPTTFAQVGAAVALADGLGPGDQPFDQIRADYQRQRDLLVAALRSIPGVTCHCPEGAYFVFPNFQALGLPSAVLARRMFEEGRIAAVSGAAFGAQGAGHLRLVFNAPQDEIGRGVARLLDFFATFKP